LKCPKMSIIELKTKNKRIDDYVVSLHGPPLFLVLSEMVGSSKQRSP
jgi:hypothetical protein